MFAVALVDQWRVRRHAFQLSWAIGMLFFGIASGCETIAAASGWNEPLYRTWYLTGAVWTAGWLGLGTAFLLGRTRFGYTFAFCLFLAGLFTFLTQQRYDYPGSGDAPILYFIAAGDPGPRRRLRDLLLRRSLAADRGPRGGGREPALGRPDAHHDARRARLAGRSG